MSRRHLGAALAAGLFVAVASCGPPKPPPDLERIHLSAVEPTVVLPGSRLRFLGSGFLRGERVFATLEGAFAGHAVHGEIELTYQSATELVHVVGEETFAALGGDQGTFQGTATLWTIRDGRRIEDAASIAFEIVDRLIPVPVAFEPPALTFMESATLRGDGFLLPGEGVTRVHATGTFETDGGQTRTIDQDLPVEVVSRRELRYVHTPEVFGLATGRLDLDLTVVNEHQGSAGTVEGGRIPAALLIVQPSIAATDPPAASRGQVLEILGRGFLPEDPARSQRTEIRLSGTFTLTDGTAVDTNLELFPEYEAPGRLRLVIRPEPNTRGELEGLGARPGIFEGTATVRLSYGGETLEGPPWSGRFQILPTKQVVYLRYLPGFSEGLMRFGMRNVEQEVRRRILEVARRDYAPYNVEFREERPTDFADYSVIELNGRDPNGAGLFGLDNTEGKDVGNLRLNDVIGGRNIESEEQGYYAFGGVFVEPFLSFSPQLQASPIASPRFDHVFGYFVPELGGDEIQAGEYPGGLRDREIEEAIRVLGNLLGNTLVHEIGHSLGMANVPDGFHHDGAIPGLIMNPGSARPFEERAELDGQGPEVWGVDDSEYLESILPRP